MDRWVYGSVERSSRKSSSVKVVLSYEKSAMSLDFLYFVTKYVVYTSVKYLSRSPNSSKVIEL